MNQHHTASKQLPANVRVMIALTASPTLLVVGMLLYTLFVDGWQKVSISMIIFSLLCAVAYYVVITGRPPRLRMKKKQQTTN